MFMSELTEQVVSDLYNPMVETKYGRLRGVKKQETYIFRGVPYGAARRFHMAQPPEPWHGVYEALAYGPSCPLFVTSYGKDQLVDPHYYAPQSENCLNLNIWTQSIDRNAGKPVLVWFHGGGWSTGSAFEQYSYDGEELSKFGDLVVVTVNHRLNCFGYLDLSSFGDDYRDSGVAGVSDLVMALRWVHENITAFGGDPGRVTVAGQSGGSAKVCAMLQCPAADGLFQGAFADGNWEPRLREENGHPVREYTTRMGELVAEQLGLSRETIRDIETVPYYDLMDACLQAEKALKAEMGVRYRYEPVPGGEFWVGHPFDVGIRSESAQIPMLLGGCFGEHSSNVEKTIGEGSKNDWDEETVWRHLREQFGGDAAEIAAEFQKAWPDRPLADALFADRISRASVLEFMKLRVASGGKVWNFQFNLESPISGGLVAWHCSELHFFFHNAQYNEASFLPGITERLEEQMAGAWVAFIRHGDPNHAGLPQWPEVTADSVPAMQFDKECCVRHDHDRRFVELISNHRHRM